MFCGQLFFVGEGYHDPRDAEWAKDTELVPVDIGTLNARSFIVYKFGCFVTDLIASRCRHAPVTILLAEKIPSNKNLARNAFRNSFHYDANNRILYIRAARLDTVGDFIVVLIHSLAHIKAGTLFPLRSSNGLKSINLSIKNLDKKRCLNWKILSDWSCLSFIVL